VRFSAASPPAGVGSGVGSMCESLPGVADSCVSANEEQAVGSRDFHSAAFWCRSLQSVQNGF
jgi:hypothetical protein